jgi:hypothetical protein
MNIRLPATALCVALLSTVVASTADAQDRQPPKNPEKEAVIRRILEITKAAELILTTMEASLPAQKAANPIIPAVFWDRFAARARAESATLIDSLVPVYDRLFTTEDLKELVRFYETPLGKRLIAATPEMSREAMVVGQRWGFVLGQQIGEQLQREGLFRPPGAGSPPPS